MFTFVSCGDVRTRCVCCEGWKALLTGVVAHLGAHTVGSKRSLIGLSAFSTMARAILVYRARVLTSHSRPGCPLVLARAAQARGGNRVREGAAEPGLPPQVRTASCAQKPAPRGVETATASLTALAHAASGALSFALKRWSWTHSDDTRMGVCADDADVEQVPCDAVFHRPRVLPRHHPVLVLDPRLLRSGMPVSE